MIQLYHDYIIIIIIYYQISTWKFVLSIVFRYFSTDSIFKYKVAQIPTDMNIYIVAI